jgi:hypothetical protein
MQMTLDCQVLESLAREASLIGECDRVRNGALRICTPLLYPNGSSVDVFIEPDSDVGSFKLTDYGQTAQYLRESQLNLLSSARRKALLLQVCAIIRLAQACVRIADFASHHALRSANPFRSKVEGFLESSHFEYEPDVFIESVFEREERIDFRVDAGTARSYMLIIPSMAEDAAHQTANEIFRKWHDLKPKQGSVKFVTVYNSGNKSFRRDDIQRLATYSKTFAYPSEQQQLVGLLRGSSD